MSPEPSSPTNDLDIPLCVDLDGTLIRCDTIWVSMRWLLKRNPLRLFSILWWWLQGRAHLKRQLAAHAAFDVAALPYHREFMDWLKQEKARGRTLVLVTAADQCMGERVAEHVGLFDEVIGSDGRSNLRGDTKRRCLTGRFGTHAYDYAGNSSVDFGVWPDVRHAIIVNARPSISERARKMAHVERVF